MNFRRKEKKKYTKKARRWKKFKMIFFPFFGLCISGSIFLLYGPYKGFSDWLITSAMTTMNHKYFATIFYRDEYIAQVLGKNQVYEVQGITDSALIDFDEETKYANKYEKAILKKEKKNQLYKLIKIDEGNLRGYLVVIYEAKRISVVTTKYLGRRGQYVVDMAKDNKAIIAINGGGFNDPNHNSDGGSPNGYVISKSKLVWDNDCNGNLVGFDKNGILIIGKMSSNEALAKGITNAVNFYPALIINGEASKVSGNGGWGKSNRTAIAQRKDGIVLFLVMDGRDYAVGVPGADMDDLIKILLRYGAYNACNLDGGTSSNLVIKNKLINKPINSLFQNKTRPIADAFIVK